MKQTIFETRQRAEELLREAINIWQQSDDNDKLEGLENDPILKLMITALAYQVNESISDLEAMKDEVLEEYAQLLTPYEIGHAVPATAVISTALQDPISELELNSSSSFTLNGTDYKFIPLLKTRLLNIKDISIVRIDGRRWKVTMNFSTPTNDLSGFAFAIKNQNFQDVNITLNRQQVPIAKPWDYSELPLSDCFGLDTILYNRSQTFEASATCLDLFARQNVRIFVIRPHKQSQFTNVETDTFDLIFEFSGINDSFKFDKNNLILNPVILVNAELHNTTLSSQTPVIRVGGYDKNDEQVNQQFLHAIRPSEEQLYGNSLIEIRRVAADRFNQGRLVKLLNAVIARYHSDYYAFQNLKGISGDKTMQALQEILSRLVDIAKKDQLRQIPGIYILLRDTKLLQTKDGSVEVGYLTTAGAGINSSLNADCSFIVPTGLNSSQTHQIANPVMGSDEITEESAQASLSRYYIATCDRIVTPADIKLFCYNELLTRYGIIRDMIRQITVNRRQQIERNGPGYEIVVDILLADNPFVKRSFEEKVSLVEMLLQKMIEVRSTNIYPIVVTIQIEK
ncbi:MAG: hypothetical protein IJ185_03930 [Prevotella sp.]|nr:hypothetical protein [Prevotella sp.]